jgi:hypothetical protein
VDKVRSIVLLMRNDVIVVLELPVTAIQFWFAVMKFRVGDTYATVFVTLLQLIRLIRY